MLRSKFMLGFSLVELMVAVGIVAILVTLALPRYRLFVARSRMAEAKTNLGIIYGLQQTYKAEFETYGEITGGMGCPSSCSTATPGSEARNELGFRVTDCAALRYRYLSSGAAASADANGDYSPPVDCRVYPNCTEYDSWSITAQRKLNHGNNAVKLCGN